MVGAPARARPRRAARVAHVGAGAARGAPAARLGVAAQQPARRGRARARGPPHPGRPHRPLVLGRLRDHRDPALERAEHRAGRRARARGHRDRPRGRRHADAAARHRHDRVLDRAPAGGALRRPRPGGDLLRRRAGRVHDRAAGALRHHRPGRLDDRPRPGRGRRDRVGGQRRGRGAVLAAGRRGAARAGRSRRHTPDAGRALHTAIDAGLAVDASSAGTATDAADVSAASARRLDDALRTFLADRGAKHVSFADITTLVNGVAVLRLTATAVTGLWADAAPPRRDRPSALRDDVLAAGRALCAWYADAARALAGLAAMPAPIEPGPAADARLLDAARRDLDAGQAAETVVGIVWTADHVDVARRLQDQLAGPAGAVATLQRRSRLARAATAPSGDVRAGARRLSRASAATGSPKAVARGLGDGLRRAGRESGRVPPTTRRARRRRCACRSCPAARRRGGRGS